MTRVFMPRTLEELIDLKTNTPDLALMAGGTDLIPALRKTGQRPEAIACLERIPDLAAITETETEARIGAGVTHTELLESAMIRDRFPVLVSAVSVLGSPHIRNMGTLGGNIVTASPAGDTLPALTILDASVEVYGKAGTVRMRLAEFIQGPGRTRLLPDQVLVNVIIPKAPARRRHVFEKVGLRQSLSIAVVSLAALIEETRDGTVTGIRLAWGSIGPTIVTCPEAEACLTGSRFEPESLKAAAAQIRRCARPISDLRASADHRKTLAGNLLFRLPQTGETSR